VWDVVSPKNIIVPKFATDMRKIDWITEAHISSVDYIFRKYGVRIDPENVKADDIGMTSDFGSIAKGEFQESVHRQSIFP
jgi:hypothetical protein